MAWLRDVPALWLREPLLTGRVGGALYTGAGLYALLLLVLRAPRSRTAGLVAPLGVRQRRLRAAEHLRPGLAHAARLGASDRDAGRRW